MNFILDRIDFPENIQQLSEIQDNYEKDENVKYMFVYQETTKPNSQKCIDIEESGYLENNKLMVDQISPTFIQAVIKNPLKIYGLRVKIQAYAVIDSFQPLSIRIFNEPFVKLHSGHLFMHFEKSTKALLTYNEFLQVLESKGFTKFQLNQIWDQICKQVLKIIFAMIPNIELLTINTLQILEFQFEISNQLQIYLYKLKYDNMFPKNSNKLDNFKRIMLTEIISNIQNRILQYQFVKQVQKNASSLNKLFKLLHSNTHALAHRSNSKQIENNEQVVMGKEDYTKPKLNERTQQEIQDQLFAKINKFQKRIKTTSKGRGGSQTVRTANYDEILKCIKVEKRLIPIYYHYKKGKIDVTQDFINKATMDEPTSNTLYQKYLENFGRPQSQLFSELVKNGQRSQVFMQQQEEYAPIFQEKHHLIKQLQHKDDISVIPIPTESNCDVVLKRLLQQKNIYSFLEGLNEAIKYKESQLQLALYSIFKEHLFQTESFFKDLNVFHFSKSQQVEDSKRRFEEIIKQIKQTHEDSLHQTPVKQQINTQKIVKTYLQELKELLIEIQQYKPQQIHLQYKDIFQKAQHNIKERQKQELKMRLIRKKTRSRISEIRGASFINGTIGGCSSSREILYETCNDPSFAKRSQFHQLRLNSTQSSNGQTTDRSPDKFQVPKINFQELMKPQTAKNQTLGFMTQRQSSSTNLQNQYSEFLEQMKQNKEMNQISERNQSRQSVFTAMISTQFMHDTHKDDQKIKPDIARSKCSTPRVQIRLQKKILQKVIPKTPSNQHFDYLQSFRTERLLKQQEEVKIEEQIKERQKQDENQKKNYFQMRSEVKKLVNNQSGSRDDQHFTIDINSPLFPHSSKHQPIKNNDEQGVMKPQLQEKDIIGIANKISNLKLREKFKQRVQENNSIYPQNFHFMKQIFPFNKQSEKLTDIIKFEFGNIQVDLDKRQKGEDEFRYILRKKMQMQGYYVIDKDYIQEKLVDLVGSQFEDFIFIRDVISDTVNQTQI